MPRNSPEAIARDREASALRYHRNKNQRAKVSREYQAILRDNRPFIGWDSEGYDIFIAGPEGIEKDRQRTMLFGCSVPSRYVCGLDLSTFEMLSLIIQVESEFPDSFHVGFSFEYDVNQILKDLPFRLLNVLKHHGKVVYMGFRISHVPHKIFSVTKDGITATIFDVFGFFHCKYETALLKYGILTKDSPAYKKIYAGKRRRGSFTYADMKEVIEYWWEEISCFAPLMDCVRDSAYESGFRITQWHGPGALAMFGLRANGVLGFKSKKVPSYISMAIQHAYAGGRFQGWQCGWRDGDIYTLDKNSAYVQAIAELPRLDNGKWERIDPSTIRGKDDIARFGLYRISFDARSNGYDKAAREAGKPAPPYPLFCRDKKGNLTWPDRVVGWYWSPEARTVAGSKDAKFLEGYVFRDDGTYPFRWVNDYYHARLTLQDRGSPAEKAFKWALASFYGAFARRVGWNRKTRTPPRTHELAWAGYITSHCRAAIYDVAAYAYAKGGLISVDTDGVTSTVPFPESIVPEGFGRGLGAWKQDKYSGILFWQNGIYWLRDNDKVSWKEAKSRGIPKGVIPVEEALSCFRNATFALGVLPPQIVTKKTRYIGYLAALGGKQFDRHRKWVTDDSKIMFGGLGKGMHMFPFCRACQSGDFGGMHTITHIPPKEPYSQRHILPWLVERPEQVIGEIHDLGSDFFAVESEIFADDMLEDRL